MAVVQISRIQQRRGKKNSQTGFPQLASGEMGWAIDTQELYIGNGAVSEGSPAVGNTKVITEHDDILALVDLYQYKTDTSYIQTGLTTTIPVRRSLQERLDDIVDAKSFGVKGDGVTDDTVALQRAIDQLFLNTSSKANASSRVILYLDPGVYKISNELRIPPYAHIVGAGIDSTIIQQSIPSTPTGVGSTTGGTLPASTYYFKIIGVLGDGTTTLPSLESSVVTTTGTTSSIAITWTAHTGAVSYQLWYSTSSGTQSYYFTSTTNSFSFTTTTGNTSGTIPVSTDYSVFRMVDGSSTPGSYIAYTSMHSQTTTWPRNIHIVGMTLKTTLANTIMFLDNTESTVIDRVKFEGIFTNSTYPDATQTGVNIRGTGGAFNTELVLFRSCRFLTTGYGIYSNSDHNNVTFDDCSFFQLFSGLDIGGGQYGSISTKVSKCYFDQVDRYGFRVRPGSDLGITSYGNMSISNMFLNVGNENQGYANAKWSIVSFETQGNNSTDDYFHRNTKQKDKDLFTNRVFMPNVQSNSMIHDNTGFRVTIDETPSTPQSLLRFPFFASAIYLIDYVINKTTVGTAVRTGTIMITADLTGNRYNINDNFNYIGDSSVENIKFSVNLQNNDIINNAVLDTLIVNYVNLTGNGVGTMNYSYRLLSV
jgi:hypothetical protein